MSGDAQVGALIGVALGGGLSFLTAYALDHAHNRRDEANRWMSARLDAYTAFLGAVKLVVRDAREVRAGRASGRDPAELTRIVTVMSAHEADRSVAFERVVLLGSKATVEAGVALSESVFALETPMRLHQEVSEDDWRDAAAVWLNALQSFQDVARRDLRVIGGFDPEPLSRTPDSPAFGPLGPGATTG